MDNQNMEAWIIWKRRSQWMSHKGLHPAFHEYLIDTLEFQQKELHYGFSLAFCLLFPLKNWSDIGLLSWTQCLYWSNISRIESILDICHVAEIQKNKFEFYIAPLKRGVSLFPHRRQKMLKVPSIQLSILLSSLTWKINTIPPLVVPKNHKWHNVSLFFFNIWILLKCLTTFLICVLKLMISETWNFLKTHELHKYISHQIKSMELIFTYYVDLAL